MSERVAHWLRPNAASRVPRRLVVLDSEARRSLRGQVERHDFRLACASFDRLGPDGRPQGGPELVDLETRDEVWPWVVSKTATAHRTVLFAHNLSYDLRLTAGLEALPELGWRCQGLALTASSFWARFTDGRRALWLCDSFSWLPAPLEKIAAAQGRRKRRLPPDDGPPERWLARCRDDVAVLRLAMLGLIAWVHDDELGDWRLTGPAQATACWRHRFLDQRSILVHDNPDALAAERRAAWSGRVEVWRHGRISEPVTEYDFGSAYARLAQRLDLPARLLGAHTPLPLDRLRRVMDVHDVLAEVVIETETPTVPAESGGRIVWPVGRFRTTLWGCELQLALDEGARVEVGRLWLYQRAPVLRRWADWLLAGLDGEPPGDDPIRWLVLKEWSRALVGRLGLRYAELEHLGDDTTSKVELYPVRDGDTGSDTTMLQLGRQLFEQRGQRESRSSTPALMGAIMAAARVQLWAAMRTAGLDSLLYVDTDGLLVDADGAARLDAALDRGQLPGLRPKAVWRSADLRAPRNLDLGETRRVSGVPRRAERLGPGKYRGEVWQSLPAALRRRQPSQVTVTERTFRLSERDPRRRHLPGGATEALRVGPGRMAETA